jgi:hypothetical protein
MHGEMCQERGARAMGEEEEKEWARNGPCPGTRIPGGHARESHQQTSVIFILLHMPLCRGCKKEEKRLAQLLTHKLGPSYVHHGVGTEKLPVGARGGHGKKSAVGHAGHGHP